MIGARITTLPSLTTLADRINPVFQRLDIGDEFTGLSHRRARRCGLIVGELQGGMRSAWN